jgi:hypothetical protein
MMNGIQKCRYGEAGGFGEVIIPYLDIPLKGGVSYHLIS